MKPENEYLIKLAEEFQVSSNAAMKKFRDDSDWVARGMAVAFEVAAHRLKMLGGPINSSPDGSNKEMFISEKWRGDPWDVWVRHMKELYRKAAADMAEAQHENRRIWTLYQAGKLEGYRRVVDRISAWRAA